MDHVRGAHKVPEEVQYIRLETLFPPWTVTHQVFTDSLTSRHSSISNDVLLFSDIGLSQVHHYRGHKRGLPHVAFRRNYMSQLRALLPLPAILPIKGGSPDLACSSVVESLDVVCASPRLSRRAFARRQPTRVMETPVWIAPGGGDLLSLICPELGVRSIQGLISRMNCRSGVLPLSIWADVDSELEQVFGDVGSLPMMVTPGDLDGALRVTLTNCPVVGVLSVPRTSPVVPAPEEFLLLNTADTNQTRTRSVVHRGPGRWPVSYYPPDPLPGNCVSSRW